jgi:hypothetical protein
VAVCADRLWFASTENQPSTIWASRPHTVTDEHTNFTVYDTVETTVVSWTDPSTWPTNPDGSYDVTDPTELQADITETNEVITADCSMELQLNSGRNDRIMWISVLSDIIVGTQSILHNRQLLKNQTTVVRITKLYLLVVASSSCRQVTVYPNLEQIRTVTLE